MIGFLFALLGLLFITLIYQMLSNLKVVGANELAVIAGKGQAGFATLRGGRVFVWPLVHQFFKLDLRPRTTSVRVESAIAAGIVPLTVEATVSFTIASSSSGLLNAIRRILLMAEFDDELTGIATSIMEGHLRDSIAAMTPEQVMTDKDILVQRMIKVCKADLEGIGLEITAMNIADVEDHRLDGVDADQQLYIALLKRVQAANAETQSREAKARARAAATEATEARRAEVTTRDLSNQREKLMAQTRLEVAQQEQRAAVEVQKATRDAEAQVAGITAQIEAEKEKIEMMRAKYYAEIFVPAQGEKERLVLEAQSAAADLTGEAQAELDQLGATVEILEQGGQAAMQAYLVEHLEDFVTPFARTMELFPVNDAVVITGANGSNAPLSAIHPHPVEMEKARFLQAAFGTTEGPLRREAMSLDLDGLQPHQDK